MKRRTKRNEMPANVGVALNPDNKLDYAMLRGIEESIERDGCRNRSEWMRPLILAGIKASKAREARRAVKAARGGAGAVGITE